MMEHVKLLHPFRAALHIALLTAACNRAPEPNPYGLDCVLEKGAAEAPCAGVTEHQQVNRLELTGARELVLTDLAAHRTPTSLVVDATLQGAFRNAVDQNLYLFLGGSTGSTPYALTADPQYAADLSYPVRTSLNLPHQLDIRVGLMAPEPSGYTPQIYVRDSVHADAVGRDAQVVQRMDGPHVHVEVPLERYYRLKGLPVPRALSVTLATARDYVGFIDHRTVLDLKEGDTGMATPRDSTPVLYPSLDTRSHRFKAVTLEQKGDTTRVSVELRAPVTDWAQTNLQFFFIPLPPTPPRERLTDPSHAVALPYAWSWYCAVYSPRRVFCKASEDRDYTYDTAYAERASLETPAGVRFREEEGARYLLEVPTTSVRAGREGFALLLAAGRDGFAPTSFYGSHPASPAR
ncbi:hypothetical protein JY651_30605 [Pyxidicoccus parkwayensis]|uniref:Lipoprotein n=1 Tax=Pyxidicoccus parkwayensis TaxID=2813578 RepID=A0ABX7NML7_9BACT|nr:hypothetical protein [Pyxidicoccus parkwaysis]QSQ19648.1 hypothetical protein JY651_30605 [Pyxidicoccus parkwaysis]